MFEQRFVIKVPFKHLSSYIVGRIFSGRVVGVFKYVVGEIMGTVITIVLGGFIKFIV